MNSVMYDGKKSVAELIVYGAMETVQTRAKRDPIGVFHDALNNIKPGIEVRSRRVGGATYQVPVEVRPERAQGAGDPLADHRRAQPVGEHHVRAAVGRAARRQQQPRQRSEEARRQRTAWPKPTRAFSHYRW